MEILITLVLIGLLIMLLPYLLAAAVTVLGFIGIFLYAVIRLLSGAFKRP